MAGELGRESVPVASLALAQDAAVEQRVADREQVEKMIDGLREREAQDVRLFHLDGKSYREISTQVGIPENTIGATLSRARAKMRRSAKKKTG